MKFLKALLVFVKMYCFGFYFSENTHHSPDGSFWGFYRFNHNKVSGMYDIDFDIRKNGSGYWHVHGDNYRADFKKIA